MRFYTLDLAGREVPAAAFAQDGPLYTLPSLGFDLPDMNAVIAAGAPLLERLRALERSPALPPPVDPARARVLAPIVRPRQDVICLGVNYYDHAVESTRFTGEDFVQDRPWTVYFSKRVSRATAPGEAVPSYPELVDSLDYEVELAVILGQDAHRVKAADAAQYIFGCTILNDVSARNVQMRHKQWYLGKSLDGFTPMGPCIVTPDELGDPQALEVRCFVNGELRQSSSTRAMIQTIAGAIEELSAAMTLQAGTIIATGTPAGVGLGMTPPCFLKRGDVMRCEIEGIGALENPVE